MCSVTDFNKKLVDAYLDIPYVEVSSVHSMCLESRSHPTFLVSDQMFVHYFPSSHDLS